MKSNTMNTAEKNLHNYKTMNEELKTIPYQFCKECQGTGRVLIKENGLNSLYSICPVCKPNTIPAAASMKEDNWENVIQYITAIHDQMEYATAQEQERLSKERLKWLKKIYKLTRKS